VSMSLYGDPSYNYILDAVPVERGEDPLGV
jgi:hypothetical protein